MIKIIIKNLRLRCIIGVNPEERKKKQAVIINLELSTNFSKAISSDDLLDTINYSDLNTKITKFVLNSRFKLLETLADRIADICLNDKRVKEVKVTIEKPNALKFADSAGVELTK